MDKQKWSDTMRVYDEYEKRFAEARLKKEFYTPCTDADRVKTVAGVKKMLRYDESLIPSIGEMEEVLADRFENYDVVQLKYQTWENFYSTASLYMPHGEEKLPLAFVFCGHGDKGRLTKGYVSMAHRLANMGIAAIVPDNIGQGDREFQGHWEVVAPFYCGLTLQGLILMESVALIRKMSEHPRVDKMRMAACGNSGGGTLCTMLAALAPELAVLSASGYPSEFSYIFSKERRHCSCNLLPGCVHGPDMWEILSSFAPKPLIIEQGENDHLIPSDLFKRAARKVGHVYLQLDAKDNFKYATTGAMHPWTNADRSVIADFLAKHLGVEVKKQESDEDEKLLLYSEKWNIPLPQNSLTADELSEKLTEKKMPSGTVLADIFKPTFNGQRLSADDIIPDIGRGDVMKILAQMECALRKEN